MKKIVYIVKNSLHYYPPCISQIRMIKDLKWNIEVLYGTSDQNIINILKKENIECKEIPNISDDNNGIFKKVRNWYIYRRELNRIMNNYNKDEVIFWFGNVESVLPLKGKLKQKEYVCFVLELLDEFKLKLKLLKSIMQHARAVCVCEKNRAYLQQSWWKLSKLPYVFPNKPYKALESKLDCKNKQVEDALKQIGDFKYVLYQGILQNREELVEIAKAMNNTKKHYKLVLMGIDKYKSIDEIKKYYNDTVYIKYIPAPLHLIITENAHIGIAYYRPDSLNKVYCAPNKIYEYSGFGIPMICNDIPGLTNTVGRSRAAECIDLKSIDIKKAIDKIDENYEEYSNNSKKFFSKTDNKIIMRQLLNDLVKGEKK